MLGSKAFVIARREYLERMRSKGFWISTIALPVLILALTVVPSLLAARSSSNRTLAVVDETGRLGEAVEEALTGEQRSDIRNSFEILLEPPASERETQRQELDRRILEGEIDAWIWLRDADLEAGEVEYHSESVSSFLTQSVIERRLTDVVRRERLARLDLEEADVEGLLDTIDLRTVRVTEEGSSEERAEAGFFLAYILFFLLYLMLMIYGQQVMNGVLEEKTSRIVEVIASTARPRELMMGKLAGICGIALTQLVLWLVSVGVLTAPAVATSLGILSTQVDIPQLEPAVIVHFIALFMIGFFVYAALYAAIGAAFNNVQEAQQFAGFAVFLLVAPMLFFFLVINDPDSTLSVVTSLFPPFTPTIMLLRIAVKTPPMWQVGLGYLLAIGFAWLMVAVAGRIYRTGILMYGKKPTLQELWRWVRYD